MVEGLLPYTFSYIAVALLACGKRLAPTEATAEKGNGIAVAVEVSCVSMTEGLLYYTLRFFLRCC